MNNFSKKWIPAFFAVAFGIVVFACGQDYNSNSGDHVYQESTLPDVDNGDPAAKAFAEAFSVLKAQCIDCHTSYHASWSKYTTEAAWKNSGYVTPGNSAGSTVIAILINNGGNMPKDGKALSAADLEKLTSWIDGMQ